MATRNLLVAHGGGPTAVINASLAGVLREASRQKSVGRVFAARGGIEGVLKGDLMEIGGLGRRELELLKRTPSSAIGSCRYKVGEGDYEAIAKVLHSFGIGYFLYTGGNDSMDTCLKLAERAPDCLVAGVPKTIDNDLAGTDHSPGFGSAARYIAVSTAELCLDIRALNIQISVLEVMGRNAGWLAAAASLARSLDPGFPAMILAPERPFDEEAFLGEVQKRWKAGGGFVVVASEGLTDPTGTALGAEGGKESVDAFGHALPGGVALYLASLIRRRLGVRARSEKPGLLGRASRSLVSEVDLDEAELSGIESVRGLCEGQSGFMVGFKRVSSAPYQIAAARVDLHSVANVERKLPTAYITSDGMNVTPEFDTYCRPLIGADPLADYWLLRR
ncbi:MAG TPA: diphosphate--fructose-6-phosphate 1-phosphotransferase [Spirochaetia bacterium]|nr:diphosphate--fructose-6-phosphate 1-phosphotransferase [Spirochaetia bacterium]